VLHELNAFFLIVHRHNNLADLRVTEHVSVRIGNVREGESPIEHRLQRTAAECAEQIGGETLTAYQRFFERAGAESYADDTRALARHLIKVAIADLSGVAADTNQAPLDRERAEVVGQHWTTDIVDNDVDAAFRCHRHD